MGEFLVKAKRPSRVCIAGPEVPMEMMSRFPRCAAMAWRNLLFLLLLVMLSPPLQAEVSAHLSSSSVALDELFTLTIVIRGQNDATPELSKLQEHFEIQGQARQQSVSIINGQVSQQRQLRLTLLPKHLGQIEIPPIQVGSEASQPLSLEVSESAAATSAEADSQAFIELQVDHDSAYPQQEIILTVRLLMAEGVRGEQLSVPQANLSDTVIRQLSSNRSHTRRDGIEYQLVEQRYSVFAYQPGELKLGGVKFRGSNGGSQSIFNWLQNPQAQGLSARRVLRIVSDDVAVMIRPIPATFTGKHWLPAKNLQIVENGAGNNESVISGKPLQRQIMLFADGLTTAQLPNLEFELPTGLKQYPDRPQSKETPSPSGISASRTLSLTLVGSEAGEYELPPIEIPWWNTETDQQEIARLPGRKIRVLAASGTISPPPSTAPRSPTPQEEAEPERPAVAAETNASGSTWLLWLLAIGWLATLGAWYLSQRHDPAQKPVNAPTVPPTAPPTPEEQLLQQLLNAYRQRDREAARIAWLRWGEAQWPEQPPSNLNRLSKRCRPAVSAAINALDRTFYAPQADDAWMDYDPEQLLKPHNRKAAEQKQEAALVPLNP
ncbi:hypothetical protein Rifp1Sym_bs00150 [endosymbiont of Riftia pachyptila (vent Ph05)]|nr:hypothetical protein Rifp1Sym_bs00150 [endosymbiont of Riftia pachyptila (vent Ph05)]